MLEIEFIFVILNFGTQFDIYQAGNEKSTKHGDHCR